MSISILLISLLQISLLQISLLKFFKTFPEYLAYAILCTLYYCDFWLMQFYVLCIHFITTINLPNAIFG